MTTTIFDPSAVRTLHNVNFGVPLVEPEADAYDATADLFHPGDDDFSLATLPALIDAFTPGPKEGFAPVNRPSIPNPPYLVQRPGPTFLDLCWSSGRSAALEAGGPVDPPAKYSVNERAAFLLGVEAAGEEMHEEMLRIEADAEMKSIGMAY